MNGFDNINIPWADWKIVRELCEDAFGKVYEIERTRHGITEKDALKIIKIPKNRRQYDEVLSLTSEDEESIRTVFSDRKDGVISEIRAVQQLDAADNIVGIKDWSVSKLDDGYSWEIYIRMDRLTPLVQYVKKNKGLEEAEVIKLGEDICRALVECEKEKIVHRDIKPDNIMVSKSGKFMLGNCGIARCLEDDTTMTADGTRAYMAPEIANFEKAGKTADIYSLGLVLYEMLNNCRPPFIKAKGRCSALEKEKAVQRRLGREELPEPANGSDALKKIVLKACDPAPSKRYRTAATMLKALEGLKSKKHRTEKDAPKPGRQSMTNVNVPWPGWEIVKELGEGSFGKVYEIERTQYGITENDALKIIRIPKDRRQYDEVAYSLASEDEESIKEFFSDQKDKLINEVREVKNLKETDNIVGIKDWSVSKLDDGYSWEIYIRMDVLTPLVQYVKKNKGLEEAEVIKLGEDICRALVECEKEKIVHRDIKPDNIMVSEGGKYKLGDFGIARYLEEDTTMTGAGTKPYMAPEIANGRKADKTVDLYSLGVVMYEMLNNYRPPFINAKGKYSALEKKSAIQRRLMGEELPEPANGSDALKRIVLKACDPTPSKRYRTAAAMLKALEKLKIKGYEEPVSVRPERGEFKFEIPSFLKDVAAPAEEEPLKVNPKDSFDWSAVADEPHRKEKEVYAEMTPSTDRSRTMSYIDLMGDDPRIRGSAGTALFCSNCGKILADDAKFCGVCGNRVQNAAFQEFRSGDDTVFKEPASDEPEDLYLNVTPRPESEKAPAPAGMVEDELEKDLFGETTTAEAETGETKKSGKFDTLYRMNEEFQKLLDEEYDKLKRDASAESICKEVEMPPELREEQTAGKSGETLAKIEKPAPAPMTAEKEKELESLRKRLRELTGYDIWLEETDGEPASAPAEEKTSDGLSLEDLEKDLFGETPEAEAETEETKKIDMFYTLYRKNEEFQKLLDEESDKLKRDASDESLCRTSEILPAPMMTPIEEGSAAAGDEKEVPAEQNNAAGTDRLGSIGIRFTVVIALIIGIVLLCNYVKTERVRSALSGVWEYSYSEGFDDNYNSYKYDAKLDSSISFTEDGDAVIQVDNCICKGKLEVECEGGDIDLSITDYTIDGKSDDMERIIGSLSYVKNSDGDGAELRWRDLYEENDPWHFYKKSNSETDTELVVKKRDKTKSDQTGDDVTETRNGPPDSLYTVGKEYKLKDDMRVRKEPSTDSEVMKASELAEEDKDKAVEGEDAVIAKDSTVKCLETSGNWIRIPSGWICGYEKGRYHIVDAEFADKSEEQRNSFCNKIGVDPESAPELTGIYTTDDEHTESVEFFEDGECAVLYSSPAVPNTDEDGYTNGVYAVKGDIVYLNYGGSVYAEAYEISGDTLIKLPEKIDLMQ